MVEEGYLDVVGGKPKHVMNLAAYRELKERNIAEKLAKRSGGGSGSVSPEPTPTPTAEEATGGPKELITFYDRNMNEYCCTLCP